MSYIIVGQQWARTIKHPTEETVEIRRRCHRKSREAAVRAGESLGFLPEPAPGQALKGAREWKPKAAGGTR